jgi:phosphatidylserine/phosphatidylglycerophosphate/cardiolipin synthase-like enzyme
VDVPLLTKARGHIDAAFYSFTDKPTAEALLAAANRGVQVRIYRDQEQFQNEKKRNPYMTTMFAGNRNIQIRVKGSRSCT